VPGTPNTYTLTVTNNGPSTVSSLNLVDTVPAALLNPVFGTPSSGSYDPATGIWSGLTLASGQSVIVTLSGTIDPTATGVLTNAVRVGPPAGVTDPNLGNNVDSDTDTLTPQADLAISKTDGKTSAVPGTPDTYTLTVTNNGPSTVSSLNLVDTVPAGLLNPDFGTPGTGSYDPTTGIWSGLTLVAGQSVTITLSGTIDAAATGSLTNRAHVAPPPGVTDTNPPNNSAVDTDTLTPQADLAITKTDGVTSVVPGTSDTYLIVVSNLGPSAVTGASVSDSLPTGVTSATWTATDSSGGGTVSGPASGTGALATMVDLPLNATVTFAFTVQIDPSATSTLDNTAGVTAPTGVTDTNPTNNSASDSDSLTPQADLAITKTDGTLSAVPGTSTTYTIVVSNTGPSTAVDQAVTDNFPAAITAVSWTAVASPGSSVAAASGTGNIATTVTLLLGGTVTFTAVAQISASATGSLTNTANVAMPAGDNTPADNRATDTDSLSPLTGVSITKDDGRTTAVPGTSTTYTIVVSNAGPSDVTGASLSDSLPTGVTGSTWTFVGETGGGTVTGPPSGTGALATTVDLPAGAGLTFSFTASIEPTATGTLVNTATLTPPGGTPTSASDTDSLTPQADLSVTKTDGQTSAVPGSPDTYSISVTNNGPSTVSSLNLVDTVPAALLNPVFGTPSSGSYDPATGIWSGLSLATGQSVTITLSGTIDPAATGTLTNTVHVAPPTGVTDTNPANNIDSDTNTLTPQANLSITKSDGVTIVAPGSSTTYTIVVSNLGPSAVTGVSVSDPVPASVTAATWTITGAAGGGAVTGPTAGTGALDTTVNLPVNATVTFTFTVHVDPSATGSLVNTATVTPPIGVTDANLANDSATDIDTLAPLADLAIIKSVNDETPKVGDTITFTVTLRDNGPSDATGVQVTDLLPAGLGLVGSNPSQGSYNPATGVWTVGMVANGAAATLVVQALAVSPGAETNTATISHADQIDTNTANNTSSVSVVVTSTSPPVMVVSLERFGFHHEPTLLVVRFSGPLDAASAQDLSNYKLILIAHGGRLRHPVALAKATYDPTDLTVTLHPGKRLPLRFHYVLTIHASTPTGVRDTSGRLLDGDANGTPGGDFVRFFGRNIVAGKNPQVIRHRIISARPTLTHRLPALLAK
jgi:uncharacterized repeat protein (TIGR01451 family)